MNKVEEFRELHAEGFFIMPNPWDIGSALALQEQGFPALASTSTAFARSIGKHDHEISRQRLVEHVAALVDAISVPLSVDSENLFPHENGGITETVRQLAEAGAAGCSIEDFNPRTKEIVAKELAAEAVAEAVEAARKYNIVLTARADNYFHGINNIGDTIERLVSFEALGAEVLYAPNLTTIDDVKAVLAAINRPLNVLGSPRAPSMSELKAAGVRRISTGGRLYWVAAQAVADTARELLDDAGS